MCVAPLSTSSPFFARSNDMNSSLQFHTTSPPKIVVVAVAIKTEKQREEKRKSWN
jgi:hypothetical protein